jgi:hypothetical protein
MQSNERDLHIDDTRVTARWRSDNIHTQAKLKRIKNEFVIFAKVAMSMEVLAFIFVLLFNSALLFSFAYKVPSLSTSAHSPDPLLPRP